MTVEVRRDRPLVVTCLPGLPDLAAWPQDAEEYRARARALGYADAAGMNAEHDACHAFLAWKLGLGCSPTLRHAAGGEPADDDVRWREEALVLAFQAVLNGLPADPCLGELTRAGLDVGALRDEALRLLRG